MARQRCRCPSLNWLPKFELIAQVWSDCLRWRDAGQIAHWENRRLTVTALQAPEGSAEGHTPLRYFVQGAQWHPCRLFQTACDWGDTAEAIQAGREGKVEREDWCHVQWRSHQCDRGQSCPACCLESTSRPGLSLPTTSVALSWCTNSASKMSFQSQNCSHRQP